MYTILFIEDDRELREDMKLILGHAGYNVKTASCAKEAVYMIESDIDIYLIDLWLPDKSGLEVLKQIRRYNAKPVLFLTACDDEASVVAVLGAGADDYVTKPFRKAELLSRIRANLRRYHYRNEEKILVSCGLVLNPFSHDLTLDGEAIELRPVEFRLLQLLMSNPERILKRERLLDAISQNSFGEEVEENTLTVYISRIRSQIGGHFIETIKGVGYRFSKPVEERIAYGQNF